MPKIRQHSCTRIPPMRSPRTNSTIRNVRLPVIVLLPLLAAFCGGRTAVRTTADDPARIDVGQLWREPQDLESRDLFHGSGGSALAPDLSSPYELIAVDDSGYSPGYDVRDPQGTRWSVKLGKEAQPELVASRVLWAVGYHQPPTYVVKDGNSPARSQDHRAPRDFVATPRTRKWYPTGPGTRIRL